MRGDVSKYGEQTTKPDRCRRCGLRHQAKRKNREANDPCLQIVDQACNCGARRDNRNSHG